MNIRFFSLLIAIIIFLPFIAFCQNIEKVSFDTKDSTAGYYLAIRPQSNQIKGVLVLLSSFMSPESLLPETKLHNVAYANDILTIVTFMNQKLYADSSAVHRINVILKDIATKFSADTSKFALAGYDESGNIALRYTELTYEHPSQFLVQPKAVFGIDTPVDLFGLWHWSERQIKKNYWPGTVGDAKYYLDVMTKENGTIYNNPEKYKRLSPFNKEEQITGNEQYLKNVAVRLYYDTDINWQLKNRRNSFYDTKMPDASELINRLLLLGNTKAEFVASKQPGLRSNGIRHPNSLSIVDEVECIQWVKRSLNIFDANTWIPPYNLAIPKGWGVERFPLPPDFAPQIAYEGVEDLRFAPGWGESTSEEYWSYAYLWWLDGTPKIDAGSLQENLKAYYTGLVSRNIISRKIPANKVVPTNVIIKKVKTIASDIETYSGEIHMLDYMTQQPIILNTLIHIRNCELQNHKTVLFEISPKPFVHSIWQQFNKIGKVFQCNNKLNMVE
ncbi:MAG: hypothetical protein M3O67_10690 [Bacteroidota bacterium]|nr:hypothetical protein [Bacteroidota bacterium]